MKPTLIIAEDVESIRDSLCKELERDFEIVAAVGTGVQAVEACRTHTPQLVLMDIVMPQMSGIEATQLIHQRVSPPPQIVIYSGLQDEGVAFQAMSAGATDYLIKPAPIEKIREVLWKLAQSAA